MRALVGVLVVLAGVGAQVSWWEHILYTAIGLAILVFPAGEPAP